jgi:nitroreductase
MNSLLRNMLMRRSIRKFSPRLIQDKELIEILEEGKLLSNAANNQVWHFTVIQNSSILKKINDANNRLLASEHESLCGDDFRRQENGLLSNIPMLLIISGQGNLKYAEDAANTVFGSMMLVAEKYGIGACWINSIPRLFSTEDGKAITDAISIPMGYVPLCVGAFGYKKDTGDQVLSFGGNIVNIIK